MNWGRNVIYLFILGQTLWVGAQERTDRWRPLERENYKSGSTTLHAFASISTEAKSHIVQLENESKALALGAIVSADGTVVTKASEVKKQVLTAKLADGRTVSASLVAVDEDNDLGLVRLEAKDLEPIEWTEGESVVGQWAVTPGIEEAPEAVGIVSVPPRKILHRQAYIGIVLDLRTPEAKVFSTMADLGADRAGLLPGDVVVGLNGAPITTREQLVRNLRVYKEGQHVALQIQRGDGEFEVNVRMMVPKELPGGPRSDREERMNRMGSELSERAEGFQQAIQHDSVLQSWQCGGPLYNLEGHAIGLNIARAGRVATYALPASLVKRLIETMGAEAAGK